MLNRRRLIAGLGAMLAAPAVIRTPGLLMPVKRVVFPVIAAPVGFMRIQSDGKTMTFTDDCGVVIKRTIPIGFVPCMSRGSHRAVFKMEGDWSLLMKNLPGMKIEPGHAAWQPIWGALPDEPGISA